MMAKSTPAQRRETKYKKARKARRRQVAKIHRAAEKTTPKKRIARFRKRFFARVLVERSATARRLYNVRLNEDPQPCKGRPNSDWTKQTAREKWLANVNRGRAA